MIQFDRYILYNFPHFAIFSALNYLCTFGAGQFLVFGTRERVKSGEWGLWIGFWPTLGVPRTVDAAAAAATKAATIKHKPKRVCLPNLFWTR